MVYASGVLAIIHFWWSVKKGVERPLPVTLILVVLLLARPAYEFLKKKPRAAAA
jgi:methionine sulfoxide reductase heme-binding subunit